MVEISLSGSGGGHGRATSRGYPTTAELPAWLRDFLRRALAGDRSITVPIRVLARVV